jgi:hypothetical protein
MNGSTCNTTKVDHAVLLVAHGHDSASGMDYWTIKVQPPPPPPKPRLSAPPLYLILLPSSPRALQNSWGPAFGEGGYVRLQAGVHCLGMRGVCQSYIGKPPE